MSNSLYYNDCGNTQTLPTNFYKFTTAIELFCRDAKFRFTERFEVKKVPAIDLSFARTINGGYSHKIKTPHGARRIHQGGPIILHLNDEFHATDLPLANRQNMFVTGFSSKKELLISEKDRYGKTIYNYLLDLQTERVIAKTVRGNLNLWQAWG